MVSEHPQAHPALVQQLVDEGRRHHQAGRLMEAENCYRQVLALNPQHADALHFLGVIAHQVGRNDVAVELMSAAIGINQTDPRYYSHISLALKELGRFEDAVAACKAAIGIKEDYAEAHHNLGVILFSLQRFEDAISACSTAIHIKPSHVRAHVSLGDALMKMGRLEEAVTAYSTAVRIDQRLVDVHFNLGVALSELGRFEESATAYRTAVRLKPEFADAHTNLGNVLRKLARFEEAIASHNVALHINPTFAEAYANLGNALSELGRHEEAITAHRAAIRNKPMLAEAHFNLGVTLSKLRKNDDAIAAFDTAIRIRPNYVAAHSNRGTALYEIGRVDDATSAFHAALSIDPSYAEAHFNDSIARLLLGDFTIGWSKYEWRWHGGVPGQTERKFSQPRWDGANFAGRTLLLYAEQGLGDTIQFCRYVSLAASHGGKIILEVQRPLLRLLSGLKAVDSLVATGESLPGFDLHCPLMSLPLMLGTTLETVPASIPYLCAESQLLDQWDKRLAKEKSTERPLARIGVAWAGSPINENDAIRSIDLESLVPLLANGKYQFFSLQKVVRATDAQVLKTLPKVIDLGPELSDFADTAAAIANMDLVITVDTSVAHLAGALGVPVWVMLPFAPDFRWLRNRSDSPWYPSARLFRQQEIGNWRGVLKEIGLALEAAIEQ